MFECPLLATVGNNNIISFCNHSITLTTLANKLVYLTVLNSDSMN